MAESNLMGPVRTADARAYQASYLRPVLDDRPPPSDRPDGMAAHERIRVGAAVSAVRRDYSGAVAEVLADTLLFNGNGGHRVATTSLPARLVDELLRPPGAS